MKRLVDIKHRLEGSENIFKSVWNAALNGNETWTISLVDREKFRTLRSGFTGQCLLWVMKLQRKRFEAHCWKAVLLTKSSKRRDLPCLYFWRKGLVKMVMKDSLWGKKTKIGVYNNNNNNTQFKGDVTFSNNVGMKVLLRTG